MEVIICDCLSCKQELGQFRNSWNAYGNNYYSPVHPALGYRDGIISRGAVRETFLGGAESPCFLQDLVCKNCKNYVGIKCDSAAEGHLLKANQYLLRLANMSCISASTSKTAEISVIERFPLGKEGASRKSKQPHSRASTAQPSIRRDSASVDPFIGVREATQGLMLPPAPPPLKRAATEVLDFEVWVEKAIRSQQKDVERISGAVERVENSMKSIKELLDKVHRQQAHHDRRIDETSEDLKFIDQDIKGLSRQFRATEEKTSATITTLSSGFDRDLGEVFEYVGQINRVDEIEDLKAELRQLKSKLEGVEYATSQTHRPNPTTVSTILGLPEATKSSELSRPVRAMMRLENSLTDLGHELNTTFYEQPAAFSSQGDSPVSRRAISGSALKRKRGRDDRNNDGGSIDRNEPPLEYRTKRSRNAPELPEKFHSSTDGPRRNEQAPPEASREVVEIASSDHNSSPITSKEKRPNTSNGPARERRERVFSSVVKPVTASAAPLDTPSIQVAKPLKLLPIINGVDTTIPAPPGQQAESSLSRNRRKSTIDYNAVLTGKTRDAHGVIVKPDGTIDRRSLRYKKVAPEYARDDTPSRPRDAQGLILRPDGTVDRRSLRYKKSSLGNKENETPSREKAHHAQQETRKRPDDSMIPDDPPLQPVPSKTALFTAPPRVMIGPSVPNVVDEHGLFESIELDTPKSAKRGNDLTAQSEAESAPATPLSVRRNRPFRCNICKTRYLTSRGLKDHQNMIGPCFEGTTVDELASGSSELPKRRMMPGKPRAAMNNGVADAEEARKRLLNARDQLVKATLERELGRPLE